MNKEFFQKVLEIYEEPIEVRELVYNMSASIDYDMEDHYPDDIITSELINSDENLNLIQKRIANKILNFNPFI